MGTKKKVSSNKKKQKAIVAEVTAVANRNGWNALVPIVSGLVVFIASCIGQYGINHANNGGGSSAGMASSETSPFVRNLLTSYVCKPNNRGIAGFCHEYLKPTRRTHHPKRYIPAGERILTVPRSYQIWDLDALRDPYITTISNNARHRDTGNPIDSGAFLAIYLARRYRVSMLNVEMGVEDDFLPYFKVLPTLEELKKSHSLMWESDEIVLEQFPEYTAAYEKINGYRLMIRSEYESIKNSFLDSTQFMKEVTEDEYWTMRVNVLSRSFVTGPPGEEQGKGDMSMEEEINLYKSERGIDLSLGCRAMAPVLDMYDHHEKPNAIWKYQPESGAFVVDAGPNGIYAKHEVMIRYGNFTDSHLMARYGFSNGDGSDPTEVSLAMHHTFGDLGLGREFALTPFDGMTEEMTRNKMKEMIYYLEYDYGYPGCINERNAEMATMELKHLKLLLLLKIANNRSRWIVEFPKRIPNAAPGKSTGKPPQAGFPYFDNKALHYNGDLLLATCRLITLTEGDYDSNAINVLREVVKSNTGDTFLVEQNHPSNEFLSYKCLERLATLQEKRYGTEPRKADKRLLNKRKSFYNNYHDWAAAQVRMGELQTFDGFIKSVKVFSSNILNQIPVSEWTHPRWSIRDEPCPPEHSLFLIPT